MRSEEMIYEGVNPSKLGELEAFKERSTMRTDVHENLVYRTVSLGQGDTAMVFLPGGMAHGDVWFPQMLDLRADCQTVSFSLPASKSIDQLARGIAYTLEQLGIVRYCVVGYSLGGLIAQVIANKYPQGVLGIALCLTGAPSCDLPAQALVRWKRRRASAFRSTLSFFSNATRLSMADSTFTSNCPKGMEITLDFWRAFIEDTYCNYVYKKQYIHLNYIAQPDLYLKHPLSPRDEMRWTGKTMVLHSPGDKLYAPEHQTMLDLYPQASVVDIGDEGQFAMLIHREQTSLQLLAFYHDCTNASQ